MGSEAVKVQFRQHHRLSLLVILCKILMLILLQNRSKLSGLEITARSFLAEEVSFLTSEKHKVIFHRMFFFFFFST